MCALAHSLRLAVALISLRSACSQSFFRHPSALYGGRRAGWPFDGEVYQNYRDAYSNYYEPPPCPPYRAMQISEWRPTADGKLAAHVALPDVRPEDRRVSLDETRAVISVRAARRLSAHGRRCLPRSARLSEDGRFEILDGALALPVAADVSRATVRDVRGGIEVLLPSSWPRRIAPRKLPPLPPVPPAAHRTATKGPQDQSPAWRLALPPADGVEVVEENFPFPSEDSDAAEGWLDNRGEFQHY